jgi:hypothetical protein
MSDYATIVCTVCKKEKMAAIFPAGTVKRGRPTCPACITELGKRPKPRARVDAGYAYRDFTMPSAVAHPILRKIR